METLEKSGQPAGTGNFLPKNSKDAYGRKPEKIFRNDPLSHGISKTMPQFFAPEFSKILLK